MQTGLQGTDLVTRRRTDVAAFQSQHLIDAAPQQFLAERRIVRAMQDQLAAFRAGGIFDRIASLVSLIGVNEMMRQAQMASASTYQPFTWYAAAALIYLAISLVSEFGLKQASRYTRRYGG